MSKPRVLHRILRADRLGQESTESTVILNRLYCLGDNVLVRKPSGISDRWPGLDTGLVPRKCNYQ